MLIMVLGKPAKNNSKSTAVPTVPLQDFEPGLFTSIAL
jgi:hypothetical protein